MSKQQKGKGKSKNTEPSRANQRARTAQNKANNIKKAETTQYKIAHAVAMKRKEKNTQEDISTKPSGYRIWLIQKERAKKEEEKKNHTKPLPLHAQEPKMFTLQARARLV